MRVVTAGPSDDDALLPWLPAVLGVATYTEEVAVGVEDATLRRLGRDTSGELEAGVDFMLGRAKGGRIGARRRVGGRQAGYG